MVKGGTAALLLVAGFAVGQLNPIGCVALRVLESRGAEIKEAALAEESPFLAMPKQEWVGESARAFAVADRTTPAAPVHLLVVPKEPFPTLLETPDDLLGEMLGLVKELARAEGVAEEGFRVIVNTNPLGGQHVYHLHMHVLGGRQMGWPVLHALWSRLTGGTER